jgi:hypothetical protein
MPTLDWLNREDAFRIAARVPTRVLRPHAAAPVTVGDAAAARDNLLVQDDNLKALAALLPFYRGEPRLFVMVFKDQGGPGIAQQIDAALTSVA